MAGDDVESAGGGSADTFASNPTVKTLKRRRGAIKASITKVEKTLNEMKSVDSRYIASLEILKDNLKNISKFDSDLEELYVVNATETEYQELMCDCQEYFISIRSKILNFEKRITNCETESESKTSTSKTTESESDESLGTKKKGKTNNNVSLQKIKIPPFDGNDESKFSVVLGTF